MLEVRRACRGGEVVDLVEIPWTIYVCGDVVLSVLKARRAYKVSHVLERAGAEIVHADHPITFKEEPLAQVAPHEPRPPPNQSALLPRWTTNVTDHDPNPSRSPGS